MTGELSAEVTLPIIPIAERTEEAVIEDSLKTIGAWLSMSRITASDTTPATVPQFIGWDGDTVIEHPSPSTKFSITAPGPTFPKKPYTLSEPLKDIARFFIQWPLPSNSPLYEAPEITFPVAYVPFPIGVQSLTDAMSMSPVRQAFISSMPFWAFTPSAKRNISSAVAISIMSDEALSKNSGRMTVCSAKS